MKQPIGEVEAVLKRLQQLPVDVFIKDEMKEWPLDVKNTSMCK